MRLKPLARTMRFALFLLGAELAGSGEAAAFDVADRTALWHVVNDLCRPMQQAFSLPLPCLKVDMAGRICRDPRPGDKTRILVVPTEKIEGIESPAVVGATKRTFGRGLEREKPRRRALPGRWAETTSAWPSTRGAGAAGPVAHSCRLRGPTAKAGAGIARHPTFVEMVQSQPGPWASRYRVRKSTRRASTATSSSSSPTRFRERSRGWRGNRSRSSVHRPERRSRLRRAGQ